MPKIFFITGASGVGKTSLASGLKEKYKDKNNWIFLHFDSIGVPTPDEMIKNFGSVENWQKVMTYEWIRKMLNEYKETEVIIFEGQVNLQFIKDGFSQNDFSDYEIILIDCHEDVMDRRLTIDRNQPELLNEDMINWLRYLRAQANSLGVKIIDTSYSTKEEVLKSFEKILQGSKILL